MSDFSKLINQIGRGVSNAARNIGKAVETIAKGVGRLLAYTFGINPDDPFGIEAEKAEAERKQKISQANAALARNRNSFNPPALKGNSREYQSLVPQLFGNIRSYPPMSSQPIITGQTYYSSNRTQQRVNYRYDLVIGMGDYDNITTADIKLGEVQATSLPAGTLTIEKNPQRPANEIEIAGTFERLRVDEPYNKGENRSTGNIEVLVVPEHLTERERDGDATIEITTIYAFAGGIYKIENAGYRTAGASERPSITSAFKLQTNEGTINLSNPTASTLPDFYANFNAQAFFIERKTYRIPNSASKLIKVLANYTNHRKSPTGDDAGDALFPNYNADIEQVTIKIKGYHNTRQASDDYTRLRLTFTNDSNRPIPDVSGRIQIRAKRRLLTNAAGDLAYSDNCYKIIKHLFLEWNNQAADGEELAADYDSMDELAEGMPDDAFSDYLPAGQTRNSTINTILGVTTSSVEVRNDGVIALRSDRQFEPASYLFTPRETTGRWSYIDGNDNDGVSVDYVTDETDEVRTIRLGEDNHIFYEDGEWRIDGEEPPMAFENPLSHATESLRGRQRAMLRAWQIHRRWRYRRLRLVIDAVEIGRDYKANETAVIYNDDSANSLGVANDFIQVDAGVMIRLNFNYVIGKRAVIAADSGKPFYIENPIITNGSLLIPSATLDNDGNIIIGETKILIGATILQADPSELPQYKIARVEYTKDGDASITMVLDDSRVYLRDHPDSRQAIWEALQRLAEAMEERNNYIANDWGDVL